MTLTSQQVKVVYVPDGVQTQFPLPFPLFSSTGILVILVIGSNETIVSGYTVEGVGTDGSSVVFQSPPVGDALVLRRDTRIVQQTDYPEGGKFPAKVLEQDMDHLTAVCQELAEGLRRTIKYNSSTEEAPATAEDYLEDIQKSLDTAKQCAEESAGSAATAKAHEEESVDAAAKAYAWANCPENVPVQDDEFSAYHWAMKAAESVLGYPLSDSISSTSSITGASSRAVNTLYKMISQSSGLPGTIIDFYGELGGPDNKHPIHPLLGEADLTYALCDGSTYTSPFDGSQITTPNLQDKFTLGAGNTHNYGTEGGTVKHAHTVNASATQVTMDSVTPSIHWITSENAPTTLTAAQMPSHGHSYAANSSAAAQQGNVAQWWTVITGTVNKQTVYSSGIIVGAGGSGAHTHTQQPHTHGQDAHAHTLPAHTHAVAAEESNSMPPFLALYKIMKIA